MKFTPVRVHPCPWHSLWMVWITSLPFSCSAWEQGAVPQEPFQFPSTSSPSLCLQNPTINHGDVQALGTLIIWLRGNLNTSFGGKNFKCVQATESLMKHKKNPAKWLGFNPHSQQKYQQRNNIITEITKQLNTKKTKQ